jgi:Sap, sulfolipid-1-addressing protein
MWGAVLVLALISAVEPVRIGITALLIARPEPMLNLLVYWLGLMATGVGVALAALVWLRDLMVPVARVVTSAAASPFVPHIQLVIGVFAVPTAAMIAVRSSVRRTAHAPMPGSDPSAPVVQPKTSTTFSRLSWPNLLEGRSLRMAFIAGVCSATPPIEYFGAITVILTSGAAVGPQVSATLMFALVAFAIAEIPLVSYLASPAKTQAVVLKLHDLLRAHRSSILAVALAVFGVVMLMGGAGGVWLRD